VDCQQYFIKNGINNVELFFKYTRDCFDYGWMAQNNKFYEGVNDGKSYCYKD